MNSLCETCAWHKLAQIETRPYYDNGHLGVGTFLVDVHICKMRDGGPIVMGPLVDDCYHYWNKLEGTGLEDNDKG